MMPPDVQPSLKAARRKGSAEHKRATPFLVIIACALLLLSAPALAQVETTVPLDGSKLRTFRSRVTPSLDRAALDAIQERAKKCAPGYVPISTSDHGGSVNCDIQGGGADTANAYVCASTGETPDNCVQVIRAQTLLLECRFTILEDEAREWVETIGFNPRYLDSNCPEGYARTISNDSNWNTFCDSAGNCQVLCRPTRAACEGFSNGNHFFMRDVTDPDHEEVARYCCLPMLLDLSPYLPKLNTFPLKKSFNLPE